MSRFIHWEIPTDNPEKVTKFFSDVFGWEFQAWGDQEYYMTTGGNPEEPGIGGAVMKKNSPNHTVTNTLGVDSIDDTIPVIEKNGGKLVVPKQQVGDMGFLAYFTDPEGTMYGLWEEIKKD